MSANGRCVLRPPEQLAQEAHRRRRVRERAEACGLKCRQQEADRDSDRLPHVVMLYLRTVHAPPPGLLEYHDDHRRVGDVRLDEVGADGGDGVEPLRRGAVLVEVTLLVLGGLPQAGLEVGVGDDDERPRLLVCAGRGRPGGTQSVLDEFHGHGLFREHAHRAARAHQVHELARVPQRLFLARPFVPQRNRPVHALTHSRGRGSTRSRRCRRPPRPARRCRRRRAARTALSRRASARSRA